MTSSQRLPLSVRSAPFCRHRRYWESVWEEDEPREGSRQDRLSDDAEFVVNCSSKPYEDRRATRSAFYVVLLLVRLIGDECGAKVLT